MAKQTINQGTAPFGEGGENIRVGTAKLQANDDELYAFLGAGADGILDQAAARAAIGLGSVDNTSDINKPISTSTQTALNAKADLVNGLVPMSQLPSYVDDVLEFANLAAMPNPGERAKIYVALDTGKTYRWADTTYVNVGGAEIADAAYKLNSARSISATGDATWSASFDGTADTTGILTLAATGVTEGNYGTDINVPSLTLDAKGRVVTAINTAIRESSTAQTGVVQLNDTTNSTSITQAATANAVKTVNDLATTANQTANAAIPVSQKGVANGVPTLGANGYIPDSQIRVPAQFLGNQAIMPIVYNAKEITADVTIPGNTNAMSAGPISVADGVTVTVETGATWVII